MGTTARNYYNFKRVLATGNNESLLWKPRTGRTLGIKIKNKSTNVKLSEKDINALQ